MINRANYLKARAFLKYVDQVTQLRPSSVKRYRFYLKHLLVWLGENPLDAASDIQPSFPARLSESRLDGRSGPLAPATAKKVIQVGRRFLTWAKLTYPAEMDSLPQLWIDSLRPPRIAEEPADHEFVTLDEIKAIASLGVDDGDVIMQRDRAAACLLYVSGMRAGAFVSLPIQALDLGAGSVQQWPSLGVRTKNSKSATTYLIDIPELVKPVHAWDQYVRASLPETAMWFTPTVNYWGDQRLSSRPPGTGRVSGLGKRMRKLFAAARLALQVPPQVPPRACRAGAAARPRHGRLQGGKHESDARRHPGHRPHLCATGRAGGEAQDQWPHEWQRGSRAIS